MFLVSRKESDLGPSSDSFQYVVKEVNKPNIYIVESKQVREAQTPIYQVTYPPPLTYFSLRCLICKSMLPCLYRMCFAFCTNSKPFLYYVFLCYVCSRKKGVFTRDKNKLFLKKHCSHDLDSIWRLKVRLTLFCSQHHRAKILSNSSEK